MHTHRPISFALSIILLLCLPGTLSAKDVTLAWDPNPGTDTAGYKVYYRPDSPNLSLDGSIVTRLDVGASTSTVINGLEETRLFYFAVTAYNDTGVESAFSNIVASSWIPVLKYPVNQAVPRSSITFNWSDPPPDAIATYTLYYGTDPALNAGAAAVPTSGTTTGIPPFATPGPMTMVLVLLLTGALVSLGLRRPARVPALALAGAVMLLASCGGGGDPVITEHVIDQGVFTTTVSGLVEPSHEATDLPPGTYYWKVVADDGQMRRESLKSQFVIQ